MDDLEALLNEVRLLWHRMVQVSEKLHEKEPTSLGMRGVLELLLLGGPAAVPQMARQRGVTRQHVQALVNGLHRRGLVKLTTNPAHERSALVLLSPAGERVIRRMRAREARVLARARLGLRAAEIRGATATLGAVRGQLGGDHEAT